MKKTPYIATGISLIFLGIYLLAFIFPEPLWAVHYPYFLSGMGQIILITLVSALFLTDFLPALSLSDRLEKITVSKNKELSIAIGLTILMGIVFTFFPIYLDTYGDSEYIPSNLDYKVPNWDSRIITDFLRNNFFHPKIGVDTVSSLSNLFAYLTGMTAAQSLILLNTLSGMGIIFIWARFVFFLAENTIYRLIGLLISLTAPCMQMYFGHYEFYGPSYLSILSFLVCIVYYFKTKKKAYLWGLILLFFIAIKFHITSYLLILPLGMVFLFEFHSGFQQRFSWKNITIFGLIPIFIVGLIIYFFILESFDGPREFTDHTLEKALFLPLFTHEPPPLDRYNLFSISHIVDYLNLILTWSPIALLLLFTSLFAFRPKINWNNPSTIIIGATLIIYAAAFFVLNPLLSLMIDWDLFSIPATILWVFVWLITSQNEKNILQPKLGIALGLALISCATFGVNSHQKSLSERYEFVGMREFKTYWIGSSTTIHTSLKLIDDVSEREAKRQLFLSKLEPYATLENDLEYSELLSQAGKYLANEKQDHAAALPYFQKAHQYQSTNRNNVYQLLVTHFMLTQYKEAHQYSRLLIAFRYPDHQKAYRIAIHTALEAKAYSDAQIFCEDYLEIWDQDAFILKVLEQVKNDPEAAKLLFQQGVN